MDHSFDPVPGEPPVAPHPDYELGAPNSWFEYELDNRLHEIMVSDQVSLVIWYQQFIPESERPCPLPKNPHCSKDYWRPQQDLREEDEMQNPAWYPKNTPYNIYNRSDYTKDKNESRDENIK